MKGWFWFVVFAFCALIEESPKLFHGRPSGRARERTVRALAHYYRRQLLRKIKLRKHYEMLCCFSSAWHLNAVASALNSHEDYVQSVQKRLRALLFKAADTYRDEENDAGVERMIALKDRLRL